MDDAIVITSPTRASRLLASSQRVSSFGMAALTPPSARQQREQNLLLRPHPDPLRVCIATGAASRADPANRRVTTGYAL